VSRDRLAFSAIADVDRKSILDYSPEHALGPAEGDGRLENRVLGINDHNSHTNKANQTTPYLLLLHNIPPVVKHPS